MNDSPLIEYISTSIPDLIALYRFGSQAKGSARPHSDIDLTVLTHKPIASLHRFELAQELATRLHRDVDLFDLPQDSRDAFTLLQTAELLSADLAMRMQRMVGFRNVAVHSTRLSLDVIQSIIAKHLDDFRMFSSTIIKTCA